MFDRGHCEPTTIMCTCETNFLSSDGRGGQGLRRDCGYIVDPSTVTECPYGRHLAGIERPTILHVPATDCAINQRTRQCYEGWTGFDCQHQQCRSVLRGSTMRLRTMSRRIAECSNRGQCDSFYGICKCDPDFEALHVKEWYVRTGVKVEVSVLRLRRLRIDMDKRT